MSENYNFKNNQDKLIRTVLAEITKLRETTTDSDKNVDVLIKKTVEKVLMENATKKVKKNLNECTAEEKKAIMKAEIRKMYNETYCKKRREQYHRTKNENVMFCECCVKNVSGKHYPVHLQTESHNKRKLAYERLQNAEAEKKLN